LVQIYAALTQLIEDKNEFIEDKYGRSGRLINIADYYLFQPLELLDKNVSIFERSVPIDVKHKMIKFNVNKNVIPTNKLQKLIIDEDEEEVELEQAKAEVEVEAKPKPKMVINKFINGRQKKCGSRAAVEHIQLETLLQVLQLFISWVETLRL